MNRFVGELGNHRYASTRKPQKGGGRFYITVLLLMVLVAAVTAALCVWFASTAEPGENGDIPVQSQPDASSQPDSSSDVVSDPSSEDASTSDKDYALILAAEQAFGKNAIDQKHTEAMNQADTMNKMLLVYDDTLEAWRKQLNTLVIKLGTYTTEDQKVLQGQWEQETAELIRKREESLSSQGGTIQQLEVAEYTCMLYRQRGLALFTELYRYDSTYIF